MFRRIILKNNSYENLWVVCKVKTESAGPSNVYTCQSDISFEIKGETSFALTLKKKDMEGTFDDVSLELKFICKATREPYLPRQILSLVPEEKNETTEESEDRDYEETNWGA